MLCAKPNEQFLFTELHNVVSESIHNRNSHLLKPTVNHHNAHRRFYAFEIYWGIHFRFPIMHPAQRRCSSRNCGPWIIQKRKSLPTSLQNFIRWMVTKILVRGNHVQLCTYMSISVMRTRVLSPHTAQRPKPGAESCEKGPTTKKHRIIWW